MNHSFTILRGAVLASLLLAGTPALVGAAPPDGAAVVNMAQVVFDQAGGA